MENERKGNLRPDSVFSKKIRAGKRRTYFFDVKSTRANDYFLTITESKKRHDDSYERFKIFVYKEDLNKFVQTLQETIDHIKTQLMPEFDFDAFDHRDEFSENQYNNSSNTSAAAPREGFQETRPETTSEGKEESNSNENNLSRNEVSASSTEQPTAPPASAESEDDLKW